MQRPRVIPCLLIRGEKLVKTRCFTDPVYVGDPVNTVRIFSDKEVDEVMLLDIDASRLGSEPNFRLIEEIAGEAFMPLAYGGGVRRMDQIERLIRIGVEKVVINSAAHENPSLLQSAAAMFGSQAVVGGIDAARTGTCSHRVLIRSGTMEIPSSPELRARRLVEAGAGEILVNSIDRDGTMQGYDLDLIRRVSTSVGVPVVACGGAGTVSHLKRATQEGGASAVAAGSMFVFYGTHRAVLISYPSDLMTW